MDFRSGVDEKLSRKSGDGDDSFLKVEYRDYDESRDKTAMLFALNDYWFEVHREDKNRYFTYKQADGTETECSELEALLYWYLLEEHCKLRLAICGKKVIGFMLYYYFFDSVLVVRGIWFRPSYRKRMLLRGLTYSVGNVSCVISQTYSKNQPKDLKDEKKRRKRIYQNGEFDVWLNDLTKGLKDGI